MASEKTIKKKEQHKNGHAAKKPDVKRNKTPDLARAIYLADSKGHTHQKAKPKGNCNIADSYNYSGQNGRQRLNDNKKGVHAAKGARKSNSARRYYLLVEIYLLQFLPVGIGLELLVAFIKQGADFLVVLSQGNAKIVRLAMRSGLFDRAAL